MRLRDRVAIETGAASGIGHATASALAWIPLGRAGRAEEVAVVIAFFSSDEASYVTGQTYDVTGGHSVF